MQKTFCNDCSLSLFIGLIRPIRKWKLLLLLFTCGGKYDNPSLDNPCIFYFDVYKWGIHQPFYLQPLPSSCIVVVQVIIIGENILRFSYQWFHISGLDMHDFSLIHVIAYVQCSPADKVFKDSCLLGFLIHRNEGKMTKNRSFSM